MANPVWIGTPSQPGFVHPFPKPGGAAGNLTAAQVQFLIDLEATDPDVENYADDEIHFRPNNTRGVAPTAAEAPNPDGGDFFKITLADGTQELWEHDGTSWILRTTIDPNPATYSASVISVNGGPFVLFPPTAAAGDPVVIYAPTGFQIESSDVGTIIDGNVHFIMPAANTAAQIVSVPIPPDPTPPVTDFEPITQAAHGIPARPYGFTPIYNDGGVWKLASAAVRSTLHDGFAVNITADTFDLVRDGFLTVAGHGLTVSADYFLQNDSEIGSDADLTADPTLATINDFIAHVVDADRIRLVDNRPGESGAVPLPTGRLTLVETFDPADIVIDNSNIVTGLDLTGDGMLYIYTRDVNNATGRQWPATTIDVPELRRVGSAFGHTFDNDFIVIDLIDAATGQISIRDQGRAQTFFKAELWRVS